MVSIVVPIYNVDKYLTKCLDSLVNQTLKDIEIILVNDGSTDNSGKIAKEYSEKYKNVYYFEKNNGGLSDARNYGMKHAKGDYIAFIDSDDYAELDTYELMYKKALNENLDYVECNFVWEYPNDLSKNRIDIIKPYSNKKEMLKNVRVVAWNKLIRKEIIDKNKLEFPFGLHYEDIEFTYKLIPHLNSYSFINETCIHYMQRNNSIANVQNKRTEEIFEIFDHIFSYYKENDIYQEYLDELEYDYVRLLLCSSLKRMCKIQDKKVRKELLTKTWYNINKNFPEWKKNPIIKAKKSKKGKYLRSMNKFTYKIYCIIFKYFDLSF